MADVLTTATRRAMSGSLGQSGWNRIGRLMIKKHGQNIMLASLSQRPSEIDHPYYRTMRYFNAIAKPMLIG